jgi:hypothetical protein
MAVSGDDLRDAARLARECAVMGHAVTLAHWIGTGRRPVTAGRVLRKADVPAAGATLGVDVPPRLRTMTDILELHRPWCAAVATGLLQVGGGWVTAGPELECWSPGDVDLLAGWLSALRAVCAAESYPQDEDSVRLLALALLTVLGEDGLPVTDGLWPAVTEALRALCDRYDKSSWEPLHAADRYYDLETGKPLAGLVELLAGFGAVSGNRGKPVITPLGRWAAGQLAAGLPGLADPGLSAGEMIAEAARFDDEEQRDHVAWGWLAEREPAEAAREILIAAEGMSPLLRSVAVRVAEALGEAALPAWRDMAAAQRVGPHARAVLAAWDQGSEPGDADWRWLGVEAAAAALEDKGPDEALSRIWESMPGADLDARLAAVQATGHPDAGALAWAVMEFAASGAPRSIDQVAELKVSLAGVRPPIWRRVRLPVTATLADLHEVIQVLFGWDGDHLHLFQLGKKGYGDPFVDLEGTGDEDAVRVRDAVAAGGKVMYTYDLGACWEHEITLEKTLPREDGQHYPACAEFRGDSPVEYWSEDDPAEPEPFGLAEVNRKLAALGGKTGPRMIEAEFGPRPDFAALFPAEDCDCEQENCHLCMGWQLTPRTADLLYTALEALADQAFDDIEEHGSEPVQQEDGGDWSVFDRLPRITWNQDTEWRRQIARACDDLTDDLVRGQWPTPRNNAEEIVLHLAIHDGPDWEEEKDDIQDEAHEALPRHSRDYDWDLCSEVLFQDHDILMLYDESLDGIEHPGDDANRYLRMGDLRPAAWFEYFANVEPRDPARGFRR